MVAGAASIHTGTRDGSTDLAIGGKVNYSRFYTDESGETHIEELEIALEASDFAPPAPPLFLSAFAPAARVGYLRFPAGWVGDWHPSPRRQLIIFLAGEVEGATSDGQRRRFGPGSVVLLEDTTGQGHQSRVTGDGDALAAVVQLPD